MTFTKIGDMLIEKDKDTLTLFFLDYKNKTFINREIKGDDVKKLAALLWSGGAPI